MHLHPFIDELLSGAEDLGCSLNHEARDLLARLFERFKVEWARGGVERTQVQGRAKVVVMRAVMLAKAEGLTTVDGRVMRLALADAARSLV